MISLREIISIVSMASGIEPNAITGRGQARPESRARGMAMWLAYRHAGISSTPIGAHFGGRDHSTVLAAFKSFEDEMKADKELMAFADRLAKAVAWKSYAATNGERNALEIARAIYLDPRRAGMNASMVDIHALASTFLEIWDIAQAGERLAELHDHRLMTLSGDVVSGGDADELDREIGALGRAIREEMAVLCGETKTPKQETYNANAE